MSRRVLITAVVAVFFATAIGAAAMLAISAQGAGVPSALALGPGGPAASSADGADTAGEKPAQTVEGAGPEDMWRYMQEIHSPEDIDAMREHMDAVHGEGAFDSMLEYMQEGGGRHGEGLDADEDGRMGGGPGNSVMGGGAGGGRMGGGPGGGMMGGGTGGGMMGDGPGGGMMGGGTGGGMMGW
jgi:hypothetical protein